MRNGRHDKESRWIGQSLLRVEDARLVKGEGRFVGDITPDQCLHVEFLRSPFPHGRIEHVDTDEAANAPGVIAVLTADDLGELGQAAVNRLLPDMNPKPLKLLAKDIVEAVGQPVVAVIATTALAARDAAERVVMDVTSLPPQEDRALHHVWSSGNVEAAFAEAAHKVSVTIRHSRLAPAPMEPRAALAEWDMATGFLTVHLSTQTPHRARTDLSHILSLPLDHIRVIAPDVGGAFGGKASLYPEDALVAFAARQLGRPVKWSGSRSEDFLAATQGRGASSEGELALSADGRILGLKAKLAFPLGHWMPYSAASPARNAGRILPGPYKVGTVAIEVDGTLTNTAAMNIYRGAGRPEAAMLMERLMDLAALRLGLDPLDIRRRNLIGTDAFPYDTPTGERLDSGDFATLLDKGSALADIKAEREIIARRRRKGEICGLGIALYIEPCGQGWESAQISLLADGTLIAATGSTAQGQGRETAAKQIVADTLQIAPQRVKVAHGDTAKTPSGIGALASRSTAIGGSALLRASLTFRDEARRAAAQHFACAEVLVQSTENGFAVNDGSDRHLSWRELAERLAGDRTGDQPVLTISDVFEADGEAWSSGLCVARVTIDRDTGTPNIENITWVDDAGVVINPMLVRGQLLGGLAQGLGEAMMERLAYDEDGQLITGSFMDYAMPRASDMPPVTLGKLETPSPANPLGAKGVGEAGCIGVPAAIVNAIVDALSPFGITHLDMPLTAPRIWEAMQSDQHSSKPAGTP